MGSGLRQLRALGQSVWLDDLRRDYVEDGTLARLIEDDAISGVTTNPAIFEHAIQGTVFYEAIIAVCARFGEDAEGIYERLVIEDVQAAADLLAPTYKGTAFEDGFVSLEVSPHVAHDIDATFAEARRLWSTVDRPNLMIKVPGNEAGLAATRILIGEGINVNVTLLFGLARYIEVVDAYCCGLEDRVKAGHSIEGVRSVASVFVSRIDTCVDRQLDSVSARIGGPLRGRAAIAVATSTYRAYQAALQSRRWQSLVVQGAHPQRLLWASTSTKNADYSDVKYVEALIASETVTTVPMETLDAYRERGDPQVRLGDAPSDAQSVEASLKALDIDLASMATELEADGIRQFADAYDRLIERIEARRQRIVQATRDVGI